jgi:hypothetical protein
MVVVAKEPRRAFGMSMVTDSGVGEGRRRTGRPLRRYGRPWPEEGL